MLPGWILNMLPRGTWHKLYATKSGYCICYQGWIFYTLTGVDIVYATGVTVYFTCCQCQGWILYLLPRVYILYTTSGVYSICYQDVYSIVNKGIVMFLRHWGFIIMVDHSIYFEYLLVDGLGLSWGPAPPLLFSSFLSRPAAAARPA